MNTNLKMDYARCFFSAPSFQTKTKSDDWKLIFIRNGVDCAPGVEEGKREWLRNECNIKTIIGQINIDTLHTTNCQLHMPPSDMRPIKLVLMIFCCCCYYFICICKLSKLQKNEECTHIIRTMHSAALLHHCIAASCIVHVVVVPFRAVLSAVYAKRCHSRHHQRL